MNSRLLWFWEPRSGVLGEDHCSPLFGKSSETIDKLLRATLSYGHSEVMKYGETGEIRAM